MHNPNANALVKPLWSFFDRLNAVYALFFHLHANLRARVAGIEQRSLEKGLPYAGASIVVADLTDWQADDTRIKYASGGFAAAGQEYLLLVDKVISWNAGWTVSQGWERFESFLKDITASYLEAHPREASTEKLRTHLKKSAQPSTHEDWRSFLRLYRGTDNKELLDFVRSTAPDFEKAETHNNRNIDLVKWYKVVAKVRHAVTHSNGLISAESLQEIDNALLERLFNGTKEAAAYRLEISQENTEDALSIFADYGFALFKALSMKQGYEWDVLGKGRRKQS